MIDIILSKSELDAATAKATVVATVVATVAARRAYSELPAAASSSRRAA